MRFTVSGAPARPVPLITNVMGSDAAQIARLLEALRRRRGDRRARAQRLVPERRDRLDIGADPRELESVLRAVRPLTRSR